MDLSTIKSDKGILLEVLGVPDAGKSCKCPFHADRMNSCSVWESENVWFWKCFAGCGAGTVIDAAMIRYGSRTPYAALMAIEKELGVKIHRDDPLEQVILDKERANEFINYYHKNLLESSKIQETYMLGKRGISSLDIIKKYRIGFAERARFKVWRSWTICGWILPIMDGKGNLLAVKLHLEKRCTRTQPKCLWGPFGTYPRNKPKNGCQALFPAPEEWSEPDRLYLCPGELKALAMVNAGFAATSPTTGENSALPEYLYRRIMAIKPKKIVIVYDNDDAGIKWRDCMFKQFTKTKTPVVYFSFGEDYTENELAETDDLQNKWEVANVSDQGLAEIDPDWVVVESSKLKGEKIIIIRHEKFREEATVSNPGLVIYHKKEMEKMASKNPTDSEVLFIHKAKKIMEGSIVYEGC